MIRDSDEPLFAQSREEERRKFREANAPLASRMRPNQLDEYIGQEHILGADKTLRKSLERGVCTSMILWGPPGVGKTTLAELFAKKVNAKVERLSAVTSGVKDIRAAIERAEYNLAENLQTVLFVDEVHRFNKSQQDAFLPYIENGTIIFIGATTENPSFELNNAILSRVRVYVLKSLSKDEIKAILMRALQSKQGLKDLNLKLDEGVLEVLSDMAGGDGRRALNLLELASDLAEEEPLQSSDDLKNNYSYNDSILNSNQLQKVIKIEHLAQLGSERVARYDKNGDRFYDLISAFHKSVRGSSDRGALYWMARIITAGGDPLYVARRLLAIASEDIGNADPKAMQVVLAAIECYERVGDAEGQRAIAQAAVYCALAPKSNCLYMAWNSVLADVKSMPDYDVPMYLRNAPTKLMEKLGCHEGYRYAHDEPNSFAAGETYLPPEIRDKDWYKPSNRGVEDILRKRKLYLEKQDILSNNQRYPEDYIELKQALLKAQHELALEKQKNSNLNFTSVAQSQN